MIVDQIRPRREDSDALLLRAHPYTSTRFCDYIAAAIKVSRTIRRP